MTLWVHSKPTILWALLLPRKEGLIKYGFREAVPNFHWQTPAPVAKVLFLADTWTPGLFMNGDPTSELSSLSLGWFHWLILISYLESKKNHVAKYSCKPGAATSSTKLETK